jgi:hypothetical protein
MDPHTKKTWIDALRSGEYKQTTGQLCKVDDLTQPSESFCCLGVLVDQLWNNHWVEIFDGKGLAAKVSNGEIGETEGELPAVLLNEVGLTESDQQHLIAMNDGKKWSADSYALDMLVGELIDHVRYVKGWSPCNFTQIADYIEKNL